MAAAVAALLLAVLSRGDAVVLSALLALAAWRPLPLLSLPAALVAATWRWGSTSLEALAGAQAVLGPAGWVGPGRVAAASWLAAAAVLLAAPRGVGGMGVPRAVGAPNLVLAGATGATVAAVVAGPAVGGAVWMRVLVALLATGAALVVVRLPKWLVDGAGVAAGAVALALVASDAPAWSGTLDPADLATGTAVAGAVGVLVAVGTHAVAHRHLLTLRPR